MHKKILLYLSKLLLYYIEINIFHLNFFFHMCRSQDLSVGYDFLVQIAQENHAQRKKK
jgi:hypothetical protein